jgi:hypothetical protein
MGKEFEGDSTLEISIKSKISTEISTHIFTQHNTNTYSSLLFRIHSVD